MLKAKVDELTAALAQTEQAQQAQIRAAFSAGWQASIDATEDDGSMLRTLAEDVAAYLASQARQEPTP